jgi:hypothetical protein
MFLEIFCILVLMIPMIWELWDDRNGDDHVKNDDWILRGLLMAVCAVFVFIINPLHNFFQGILLSIGIFAFAFPWLINYILFKHTGNIYDRQSSIYGFH